MRKKALKNKEGSALLIAIVIMMVVTMLSLALLLVSYSLFATVNKQHAMEQCKEMAQSVSRELEAEITGNEVAFGTYDKMKEALEAGKAPLWFYLRFNLWQTSWPYYNSEERGHTSTFAFRYFNIEAPEGTDSAVLDNVSVKMYWECDKDIASGEKPDETLFTIQVTCEKGKQKSVITSTYVLSIEQNANGYEGGGELRISNSILNPENNMIQTGEKWTFSQPDRE